MVEVSHKAALLVTDLRFDVLSARIVKYYSLKRFGEETGKSYGEWGNVHDAGMFHYSSGMQAIMLALGICDKVSVFGFGKSESAKHHYHTNQKAELRLHDYEAEYAFYRDLVERPQIFFFLMFLTTCKARKLYAARSAWHSGWIFLVLRLISVIQFIRWWNNYWMPEEQKKQSCSLGLFMSTLFYIGSMCGIALLYLSYAMKSSCALNIFFIIWTAVLRIVMMSVSLHSKVNRGLLSSGIMASYIVFLCWSAIRSEPANEECNPKQQGNENGDWTTILGFLIAISAIESQSFQASDSMFKKQIRATSAPTILPIIK